MFMMLFRLLFFCLLTITNVAAAPHQHHRSAITRRFADTTDVTSIAGGILDGNGNMNGDNGNGDTPGDDGNMNGGNGNGDEDMNTILIGRDIPTVDISNMLAGVLNGNGNGGGNNANDDTNGENGNNNGMNLDGDEDGNTILVGRSVDVSTLVSGVEDANGNGNGGNGNGDTNGEDGNDNGMNLDGDEDKNTILVGRDDSTADVSTLVAGVLDGNGNGNGGNGNGGTNGEDGNNNGDNGNGDLSGNVINVGPLPTVSA